MSGRAVGGAAGAGCAAFSFIGILVSVVIVVWLGSQTMGGDDSKDSPDPTTVVDAANEQVEALGDVTLPGASAPGTSVIIDPSSRLADQTSVQVTATGFAPGPAEMTLCLTNEAPLPDGLAGCDPATTLPVVADQAGTIRDNLTIVRVITIRETAYDCAAFPSACTLIVHPTGAPDEGARVPLAFVAEQPPVDAERPPG